jgi:catechol-2,3-dioxygenase
VLELASRAVLVDDLVLAERFYAEILGKEIFGRGAVDSRYLLSTDELLELRHRAASRASADGEPDFWTNRPPYANVTVGRTKISLYVADRHNQEPPPEQLRGLPRIAISATGEEIARATGVLDRHEVPFEGPVHHAAPCPAAQSLYFKDPAGNFLELCQLRAE